MNREHALASAFVDLADTLVSDYDVADLMHRLVGHTVRLLDVSEAGLLLSDQRGSLHVMASTTEQTKLLELFQIQSREGPCLDCYRTGVPLSVDDLADHAERWPTFAPVALEVGYRAVHTFPMRLREVTIGALNLFNTRPGTLSQDDGHIAQGLADVATIGLLQERAIHESVIVVAQLEGALASRVVIEQAKGVLAEQGGVDMDVAFERLRERARGANRRLADIAREVIAGEPKHVSEGTGSPL
ncbi:GAF and ANTAR domain-containing protein [Nocardioides humilatus]|uniref:GAF and ANTAR domain-containing protein n=1 Tax=Nocardioides humilatus TaxID=2607660 RepID=A0A5B1LB57_9ACTN|nr:GAF and ANTAR domain-containing protein [Nocardioides humilatus]KAA1416919.1 GAF and ANTAR domain-containing protein [Nocardioides humilatus]